MELFMESKFHNSCLNRKVTIDKNGDVYNCWNIGKSFGNIETKSIFEILGLPGFKKHWQIKKDEIAVCKDCEFRNICTDCRAFLNDPSDIYSKPLKCGYDPYTNTWEDWSSNLIKQKIMGTYSKSNTH
jgi:SPASM domain peptide maturase of grasp-with-spasm system